MKTTDNTPPLEQGETPGPQHIKSRDALLTAINALLAQAQRELILFGPLLDGQFFNTAEITADLGSFIARHRANRVRIVIEDEQQFLQDNTRLANLARRFADAIQIRRVGESHRGLRDCFMVADHQAYLQQLDIDNYHAVTDLRGTQEAIRLLRRFNEIWDMSETFTGLNPTGL